MKYPCVYCTEDSRCLKYTDEEHESWCVLGPCEDQTPSRGDELRCMNDEELATWILDIAWNRKDDTLCPVEYRGKECPESACEVCWIKWLGKARGDKNDCN